MEIFLTKQNVKFYKLIIWTYSKCIKIPYKNIAKMTVYSSEMTFYRYREAQIYGFELKFQQKLFLQKFFICIDNNYIKSLQKYSQNDRVFV